MNHPPLVSIIMPAYRARNTIAASIASVQAQTVTDWELLVVDDGSTDDTVAIVRRLAAKDPRIVLLENSRNMGVAASRNRGLEVCQGRYVALLDSDDRWTGDKLERQLAAMEQTGGDFSCTAYTMVDGEGRPLLDRYAVPERISYPQLLRQNYVGCSTVLMTAALAKEYRFTTEYYHEDYVMWLEMLRDGKTLIGVNEALMHYYYRPDSRAGNKRACAKYRWQIYRHALSLPLLPSLGYMLCYALAGIKKYRKI